MIDPPPANAITVQNMSQAAIPSTIVPLGRNVLLLPADLSTVSPNVGHRTAVVAERVCFILLLLVITTLLVRPNDLFRELDDVPIYETLITGCIVLSLPKLLRCLTPDSLLQNGILMSVVLLIPLVMLSHLAHADIYDARLGAIELSKGCALFLLVICTVNSFLRFRLFLEVFTFGVFLQTLLAVMQFHGMLNMHPLQSIEQKWHDPNAPDAVLLRRLCGIGVFHDPNDFSLILVIAIIACIYDLRGCRKPWLRTLLLVPPVLFGYALFLTRSRGGMMAAVGALLAFMCARLGCRNALTLALLTPFLLLFVSGRQTQLDIDNPQETFQGRLGIWSDSLDLFRNEPIFGLGQGKVIDTIGHVCHNSYLQAFVEMGVAGGIVFTGAFYLALRGLWRATPVGPLARLRPYVLAIVASYAIGLISLSRCYTVPTQLILALGTAFLLLAGQEGGAVVPRFDIPSFRRASGAGAIALAVSYAAVRFMIQR